MSERKYSASAPSGLSDERAQVRRQLIEVILAVEEAVESEGRQFGEPIGVVSVVEVSELVGHRPRETDLWLQP